MQVRFVRATGEATVTVKPDRAQVSIGVVNQSSTAQAAASANASQTNQVIETIRRTLGSAGELKTAGYSVAPQYASTRAKITGFQASNTILVVVNDLSMLGKVIDAASETGANNINSVTFGLKDDRVARSQALAEAAAKARTAAEAIAHALGVQVVGLLQAETDVAPQSRPMTRAFATPAGVATPMEAGDVDISAAVTVTLEVQ